MCVPEMEFGPDGLRSAQPANGLIKRSLHPASKYFGTGVPMSRTTVGLTFVAGSEADSTTDGVSLPV